ncbi:MAG: hypothetical protein ACOX08_00155 [Methanobacterium sp.]
MIPRLVLFVMLVMVVFVVFYCFHDQITNRSIQLAQNLTSSNLDVWPEQFHSISDVMFLLGNFASILGHLLLKEKQL